MTATPTTPPTTEKYKKTQNTANTNTDFSDGSRGREGRLFHHTPTNAENSHTRQTNQTDRLRRLQHIHHTIQLTVQKFKRDRYTKPTFDYAFHTHTYTQALLKVHMRDRFTYLRQRPQQQGYGGQHDQPPVRRAERDNVAERRRVGWLSPLPPPLLLRGCLQYRLVVAPFPTAAEETVAPAGRREPCCREGRGRGEKGRREDGKGEDVKGGERRGREGICCY